MCSSDLLSIVGMPAALLQALVAVPLLRTLFNERWWDAAELLQILSLAMAFQLVGQSTSSMLKSQRRYTDRKSVVEGKSVDLGGRRIIKKKKKTKKTIDKK